MLLDSNIIIYSALEEHEPLREFIAGISPAASEISMVEVLGYPTLSDTTKEFFKDLFETFTMYPVSDDVITNAIKLRQTRKMSLGDSIVAATALVHDLEILTHNTKDFSWIPGLAVSDPLED